MPTYSGRMTSAPTFDLLIDSGRAVAQATRIAPEPGEPRLGELLAHPAPRDGRRVHVRANMVASVDGGAWGADHRSGSINDVADLRVFEVLRALADAVLVGAGTIRAERYGPVERPARLAALTAAAGRSPGIVTAVVSRTGVLPPSLLDEAAQTMLLTTCQGAAAHRGSALDRAGRLVVVDDGDGGVVLHAALDALAERGLTRVLTEGGPHLLATLLDEGLVDELMLTTSPRLVGPAPGRIVAGPRSLQDALDTHAAPAVLLHAGGTLITRWVLRGR